MKTKVGIAILGFLFGVSVYLFSPAKVSASDIDFHIGIGIGVPAPRVVIYEPPPVFLIPDTHVYYAPYVDDLFFYSGYWYLFQDGYWFRAAHYSGPWVYLPQKVTDGVCSSFIRLL